MVKTKKQTMASDPLTGPAKKPRKAKKASISDHSMGGTLKSEPQRPSRGKGKRAARRHADMRAAGRKPFVSDRYSGKIAWGAGVTPNERATVYWRNGSPIVRNRHQVPASNAVGDAIGRYYAQGGDRKVIYVFKERSSRMWSSGGTIAVKFAKDEHGVSHNAWIDARGNYITERQMRTFFKGIDATTFATRYVGGMDYSGAEGPQGYLTTLHDMLTPMMKTRLAESLMGMDLNRFWEEFYPQGDSTYANNEEMYLNIYRKIIEAAGGEDKLSKLIDKKSGRFDAGTPIGVIS